MNLAFLLVNILVLLTVFISNFDLSIHDKGWLLGLFTGLSYLILPWFFYWFVANYEHFLQEPTKLYFSKFQTFSLVSIAIIGLIPIVIPSLITVVKTETYSLWNWDYGWQILAGEFLFWILFAVLCINIRFDLQTKKIDQYNQGFLNKLYISAIIVFSTPVFFVVSSGFILLSLLLYIASYYIAYDGLKNLSAT